MVCSLDDPPTPVAELTAPDCWGCARGSEVIAFRPHANGVGRVAEPCRFLSVPAGKSKSFPWQSFPWTGTGVGGGTTRVFGGRSDLQPGQCGSPLGKQTGRQIVPQARLFRSAEPLAIPLFAFTCDSLAWGLIGVSACAGATDIRTAPVNSAAGTTTRFTRNISAHFLTLDPVKEMALMTVSKGPPCPLTHPNVLRRSRIGLPSGGFG